MEKSNLKILLVAPRDVSSNGIHYNYMFPLGIAYISAVLKKAKYDVSCLNLNHREGLASEIVRTELGKKKYDLVATGHVGMGYSITEKILETARAHPSKPKTILGGAIITSEPQLMFESLKPDFGVLGEGEETILELLKCIENEKDFKKVNGIMYRDYTGKIITTPPRKPIENIDKIPFPDFEGFEFEEYLDKGYTNMDSSNCNFHDHPRLYSILCSRSCPFHCTFCYHTLGSKYRERSIKNVIEEIKFAVEKYKINAIAIYDDLFSYKKERIYEFCREMVNIRKNESREITWTCQLSVLHVDRALLRVMKKAGCVVISYGFESYSEEVLKSMKKPITPEQIDKAFKITIEEKIGVQGYFIFGDIVETKQTAKKTLDYWKENCKGQIFLDFIQPYPGCELYEHCLKKGIIKDKLTFIRDEMKAKHILNMTDRMTDKDIRELQKAIIKFGSTFTKSANPLFIKPSGDNKYEIVSKCPFCNEKTTYRNFLLQSRHIYRSYMICRKCGMRYYISSPLFNLLRRLNLADNLEKAYHWALRKKAI